MAGILLGSSYQLSTLISSKFSIEQRLMELRKKLLDMQSYSASIGDNEISIEDMMNCPASQFTRMNLFLSTSHQDAYASAENNFRTVMATNQMNLKQYAPDIQQQMQQSIWTSLYKQAREKAGQQEEKRLNAEEKKIELEVQEQQTQLEMVEEDIKNLKSEVKEAAKEAAPEYV